MTPSFIRPFLLAAAWLSPSMPTALLALAVAACAPASDAEANGQDLGSGEGSLSAAKDPATTAFLSSVAATATPQFLVCRSAAGVSPKLELGLSTRSHSGAATVVIRQFHGARGLAREWVVQGALDGIPRAGDLQGTVSFALGADQVSFDYVAEEPGDVSTLTFHGHRLALLCTTLAPP